MIAIYLSPIYFILNYYLIRRILTWLGCCHPFFEKKGTKIVLSIIYAFFVLSIPIAFIVPASSAKYLLKLISNYWFGVVLYLALTVLVADLIRLILKRVKFSAKEKLFSKKGCAIVGAICTVVICAMVFSGIYSARNIITTDYEVSVDKSCGDHNQLNIVLVADLHLGYSIGNWHMEQMVKLINAQNPDLVVIAGDIFDNEYEALDNPDQIAETLSTIESKYGVYACYGNHDIQEKILAGFTFGSKENKESHPKMDEFMEKANIQLLRDEAVLIDNSFYVYGRPDYERPGRGIEERKTPEEITADLDNDLPIIVIDHEPRELQELADAGVDLDLCGHTHNGQTFPGNLTIKLFWENTTGYLAKDDMHNIVTSGIGVFGPNMRLGTKSEICNITVDFNN